MSFDLIHHGLFVSTSVESFTHIPVVFYFVYLMTGFVDALQFAYLVTFAVRRTRLQGKTHFLAVLGHQVRVTSVAALVISVAAYCLGDGEERFVLIVAGYSDPAFYGR